MEYNKIKLRKITDPTIFRNYFMEIPLESIVNSFIKNDVLKLAASWKQNSELWENAEEVFTYLVNKVFNKEFEAFGAENKLNYNSNDLKLLIHDLDETFIHKFSPDIEIAINGNEFITDLYRRNPIALCTLKYLGTRPNKNFKGVIQTIEYKHLQEHTLEYTECLEYLRNIGFIFKGQVESLYRYLGKLPYWQKSIIENRLSKASRADLKNMFDYIKQQEIDEINRCEYMTPNFDVTRLDWGDPFEGPPENSPSY